MKKITLLLKINAVAFLSILLVACSGQTAEDGDNKLAMSAFLNGNEEVIAFGATKLKDVLEKSDYKSIPNFGEIIEGELSSWNSLLDLDAPVYYALEGPLDRDGAPTAIYAFVKVKSPDSLESELVHRGYEIEKHGEINIFQDEDVAVGFKGHMAILLAQGGDVDHVKLIKDAFSASEGEVSEGTVSEILDTEGDIVFAMNIENIYATSDTDLADLSKDKQDELKEMVAGSYVQTSFKFENGAAIIETKNLFSDALMERMFINEDPGATMIATLGHGEPRLGISVNIDLKKMQSFVDEFSPNALDELTNAMGPAASMAMMTAGADGLSGIFTGKFGLVMFGDLDSYGGAQPDFNFFVGLTSSGASLGKMAKEFLGGEMALMTLDSDGLSASTNASYASSGRMDLPAGCENFGKTGISGFFSFDGIDIDDLDLDDEANFLRIVDYVTFEYGNEGGRIYIKAKKGQENVLKQIMTVAVEELASGMGGF
ncbi:MAG: hypothetical protein QNK23_03320 [Crocinitomicaceae bacterium]|nr:hypothetical protein [Crocinitomicaceae bacterium]